MRGLAWPQLSPTLDVTLTGGKAANAISADILDQDNRVIQTGVLVTDGFIKLEIPLESGKSYVLALKLKGRAEPLEVSFVVSNSISLGASIFQLE